MSALVFQVCAVCAVRCGVCCALCCAVCCVLCAVLCCAVLCCAALGLVLGVGGAAKQMLAPSHLVAASPFGCCPPAKQHPTQTIHPSKPTHPQEKSDVEPSLPPALAQARTDLTALVAQLAEAQAARGLAISAEDYTRAVLHPGLMEVRVLCCTVLCCAMLSGLVSAPHCYASGLWASHFLSPLSRPQPHTSTTSHRHQPPLTTNPNQPKLPQ